MKLTIRMISLFTLAGILLFAAEQPGKKGNSRVPPPSKPGSAKDTAEPPANAEKQPDGTYISTDAKGKRFVHKRTPFGWAKYEEGQTPSTADKQPAEPELIKAVKDLGDTVRFEKPGPFGTFRWERKKTELNDSEKAAWEKFRASR